MIAYQLFPIIGFFSLKVERRLTSCIDSDIGIGITAFICQILPYGAD